LVVVCWLVCFFLVCCCGRSVFSVVVVVLVVLGLVVVACSAIFQNAGSMPFSVSDETQMKMTHQLC